MRSSRVKKPTTGMALFPFLAVLICTMGALIVLLMLVVQQARVQADVVTRERTEKPAAPAKPTEEEQREREDYEWRREMLEKQRAELTQKLAEERLDMGHLEDHIRRLQDQWRRIVAQAEELERTGKEKRDESAIEVEKARLKSEIELAKRDLEESKKKAATKPKSFAIIPYNGPNGTHRRPIYIECRGDAIIFQPEGVMLGPADFDGPMGPGNPFDAALRATREYLASGGANKGGEPYPLLVVRPDGAVAYALARSAMKSWDDEFGYELIDQEMKLEFPPGDPQLANTLQRALQDARRRQEALARVAPSRFKGVGSSSSRGGSGGGEGGSGSGEGFNDRYVAQGGGSGFGNGSGRGIGNGNSGSGGVSGVGTGNNGSSSGTGGFGVNGSGKPGENGSGFGAGGNGKSPGGTGIGPGGEGSGTGQPGFDVLAGRGGNGAGEGGVSGSEGVSTKDGPGGGFYGGSSSYGKPGQGQVGSSGGQAGGTSANGQSSSGQPGSGRSGGGQTGGGQLASGKSGTGSPGGFGKTGSMSSSGEGGSSGPMGGSPGAAPGGGSPGMPTLTLGEDLSQSGSPSNSANEERRSRARRRTPGWGLPNSSGAAVGYTRPIRVTCSAEKLVILPERGDDSAPRVVPLNSDSPAPVDDFVDAVWKHMDRWGIAGQRAYWKPVLSVQVAPGGEERFAELEAQLQGSGLDVKRK